MFIIINNESFKCTEMNVSSIFSPNYYNLLNMYAVFGCEIIVLDDKEDVSDAEELTRDLMALLASFSGKYYGRRSLERRKQNKNIE